METILNLSEEARLNISLCFFCQKRKKSNGKQVPLRNASDTGTGISTIKDAARQREEHGEITIIIKRVHKYLNDDTQVNISSLKWHKDCYFYFTSQQKIDRLISEKKELDINENANNDHPYKGITRSKVDSFDWEKCMFCQKNSDDVKSVTEERTSIFIKDNSKLNLRLFISLSTVSDCMSAEAKYHLNCYTRFIRLKEKNEKDEKKRDYALIYVLEELFTAESEGDVVSLNDVWESYSEYAVCYNVNLIGSYKDKHTFGICLKNKLEKAGSSYKFFNKLNNNETIMFPTKYLKEGISSVIEQNEKEIEESIIKKCPENNNDFLAMVHVAFRLRGEIEQKAGYKGLSVSEDEAIECIPENLYLFLSLLFGGSEVLEIGENEYYERGKWTKNIIMSIAQDIIFGLSKGKKWTPKHIGLTSTLHQKTRSKDLVNLFHQAGHCLSYESLLKIDKTLADDTLASMDEETGAVFPRNFVSGKSIHFSADNLDVNIDSLDGKEAFHVCQVAAYQRSDGENQLPFSHIQKVSTKRKSCPPEVLTNIPKVPIQNEKLSPVINYFTEELFSNQELNDSHIKAKAADNSFYMLRQDMPNKIGWTEFNQKGNVNCSSKTTIGCMPMILNPAHEYDTLNLVIRRCMAISSHYNQEHTVLTVDQQLFCKLHILISNTPEFQHKVFPRLGGLHISLNFQKIIGKHMSDCGLHETWIESSLLGEGASQKVFAGKSYSKSMRAHKLTVQALWRMLIPKFMNFLSSQNPDMSMVMHDEIKKYSEGENNISDLMNLLQTDEWRGYLSVFVKEESDNSVNFSFWWKYMEMVSILLMFTRAQRDGDWELYLTAFRKMIPYFFQYDHQNYARWSIIYLAQMMEIPEKIKDEFMKGDFVVKCSDLKFTQVDPDHAQEWLNRASKIAGGIIGITNKPSALMNWNLTYNARSFIANQTYDMFGLKLDRQVAKETTNSRKGRDNTDEDKLLETLTRFGVFEERATDLINIATKDVATYEIQESLLNARENGEKLMIQFVKKLLEGEVTISADEFYKNIERNNAKTFKDLYLKTVKNKEMEKKTVIKADRNFLVRIIKAYQFGQEVNLSEILRNEILPVPLSLAGLNGLLNPGDKALLQKKLLENIDCPETINLSGQMSCLILDGQALVCSIRKPKGINTFGQLADKFIQSVLAQGFLYVRIDVVFDRYRVNSIKENTRSRRTKNQKAIRKMITGRDVPLPENWDNFMACKENKSDYANFLSTELKRQAPNDKQIVISGGFKDELEVWSSDETIDTSKLSSTHEEADTRMVLHAIHSGFKYIVISSKDTDVLVLLASHFHNIYCTELWMIAGTKKKTKCIPVHNLVNVIPQHILEALIPFHTLTGCDTTSFIAQHSKMTAWNVLLSDSSLIKNLGAYNLDESDYKKIEKFFCILYGMPDDDSINTVRYKLFLKKQNPDALPPTCDALHQHIKRSNLQSLIWNMANIPRPILPDPVECGYEMSDIGLKPILMIEDAIPNSALNFFFL